MATDRGSERIRKAEKEVGDNIPRQMIGLDTEDVADLDDPRSPAVPARTDASDEEGDKTS